MYLAVPTNRRYCSMHIPLHTEAKKCQSMTGQGV